MVNEEKIAEALETLPLGGNEEGLIPAFGVYLTRMYAGYYNRISYRFEKILQKKMGHGVQQLARPLLIEAGHVCAFNTFGGIMKSQEWEALVGPMLENREDWVRAIVVWVRTLGWGDWQIKQLVPGRKLTVTIEDSYESEGYLEMYGCSTTPECYLATGAVAGIMNLLYHGDITLKPELTEAYYEELFKSSGSFGSRETRCRSMGDPICEITAMREDP